MTTYFNFSPSPVAPYQFAPTFDGQQYNVIVTWNVYGQRWYINVYDLSNNLIVSLPMTGSPTGIAIQSLAWDVTTTTATVETVSPHGYKIGATIALTLSGNVPTGFNGTFRCLIVDPVTFTFPLANDPGQAVSCGAASYNVNLVAGYFVTSSLVFRQKSAQFEVTP